MTVSYRYIGKGKTDANGVAHITEDAEGNDISSNPGYTGVGAGEIDVVASVDKPITSGSVQSTPFPVCDATFYGDELSKWIYNSSQINASKNGDEITISTTDTTDRYLYANVGSTSSYDDFVPPYALEFDVVSFDGYIAIMNWASGNNGNRSFTQMGATANSKIKILVKSDKIEYYLDGTKLSYEVNITGTPTFRVGLVLNNSSITFKNFRVYPI